MKLKNIEEILLTEVKKNQVGFNLSIEFLINKIALYFLTSRVQWKVIHSVLEERRDNVVVMATGKLC